VQHLGCEDDSDQPKRGHCKEEPTH
jgi:hypothetical protein